MFIEGAKNIARTKESDLANRIIYGQEGKIEDVPYQISMQTTNPYDGSLYHICGGTILSETVILTAAHCFDGLNVDQTRIRAGSTENENGGQILKIKESYVNENYDEFTLENDIALIVVDGKLEMSDKIKAAQLPDDDIPAESTATISGWGYTDVSTTVQL